MEEMQEAQYSTPENDDPLAPISSEAIDRVVEINGDSAPRKSVRQRLGSMAARRSARRYEADPAAERPHIVEQTVIVEMGRMAVQRTVAS